MRKSSAPSQAASKKPKFCTPFVSNISSIVEKKLEGTIYNNPSKEEITPINKHSNENISFNDDGAKKNNCFKLPLRSPSTQPLQPSHDENNASDDDTKIVFYSVVWCKMSKKKHKKWEGDAVLKMSKSTMVLMDTEGKIMNEARNSYKWSEMKQLQEGNTVLISGKLIEIQNSISANDFNSGKCFSRATTVDVVKVVRVSHKPFIKHSKEIQQSGQTEKEVVKKVVPSGAFVLPPPPPSHQFNNNTTHHTLMDVYVDLFIAKHLRPHQKEGVAFLYRCIMGFNQSNRMEGGAILADEMGLGKTLQCLSIIWTLYKQGPYGKPVLKKILVVVPGSLVKNWLKEFKKWISFERMKVFAVSNENKVQEYINSERIPVLIISYEMLLRNVDLLSQVKFDLVICDEGHRLKNSSIKTSTSLSQLNIPRRIVLTGTPIQNDLQELFALVHFVCPHILGSSNSFKHVYEDPILASRQPSATNDVKLLGNNRAQELNKITSQVVLRRTQEINNKYLPPKVEIVLFCGMSDIQLDLYNKLVTSQFTRSCIYNTSSSSSSSSSYPQHLTCISALRKLCNHPELIYDDCVKTDEADEEEISLFQGLLKTFPHDYKQFKWREKIKYGGKMTELMLLLSAFKKKKSQKVVVVSNYTKTLDVIEGICTEEGYDWLRLDGATPTNKRQALVDQFNNPLLNHFIFLLSTKAGGVGLNLIGASRLVLFDVDWNPANDLQAMARVWRDGQKDTTVVYRLLSSASIEETIYQRQVSKQSLSGVVVDGMDGSAPLFSMEQLKQLFKPIIDVSVCLTHQLLACPCADHSHNNNDTKGGNDLIDNDHNNGDGTMLMMGDIEVGFKLDDRPCQLFKEEKRKNSGMDELMRWKHIPPPCPLLHTLDPLLTDHGFENVTFAFSSETNKQPVI